MKSPEIILVDQDGVIADFDLGVVTEGRIFYPNLEFKNPDQRQNFYITEDHPGLEDIIKSIYTAPGFIRNLSPVPGAIEALIEMQNLGLKVLICTSPLSSYKNCVEEKHAWVEKHLGKNWVKNVILAKDKTLVRGNILIDDRPEVSGILEPTWEHVIFDRPYNRHVPQKRRLTSWQNWQDLLKS